MSGDNFRKSVIDVDDLDTTVAVILRAIAMPR